MHNCVVHCAWCRYITSSDLEGLLTEGPRRAERARAILHECRQTDDDGRLDFGRFCQAMLPQEAVAENPSLAIRVCLACRVEDRAKRARAHAQIMCMFMCPSLSW